MLARLRQGQDRLAMFLNFELARFGKAGLEIIVLDKEAAALWKRFLLPPPGAEEGKLNCFACFPCLMRGR